MDEAAAPQIHVFSRAKPRCGLSTVNSYSVRFWTCRELPKKLTRNVKPISYLKTHAAKLLRAISKEKNPLLISHHGEVKFVIQDIGDYEALLDSLTLLKILALGERSRKAGRSKPLRRAFADLRRRIGENKK